MANFKSNKVKKIIYLNLCLALALVWHALKIITPLKCEVATENTENMNLKSER